VHNLILNFEPQRREERKGCFFIALRAGYSTFVNSVGNFILNRPGEIRATEISSRLNKCKKGLTGQVGQAAKIRCQILISE